MAKETEKSVGKEGNVTDGEGLHSSNGSEKNESHGGEKLDNATTNCVVAEGKKEMKPSKISHNFECD